MQKGGRYSESDPLGILEIIIPKRMVSQVSTGLNGNPTYLGNMLNRGRMPSIDTYVSILDALGYSLVVRGHGMEYVIASPENSDTITITRDEYNKILAALGTDSLNSFLRG